jgi:predicted nucleic acid-binding protein
VRVDTVSIDEHTSIFYAKILNDLKRAGTPIPSNDVWIAASAMQHGLVLLTADAHFQRIPQIIVSLLA